MQQQLPPPLKVLTCKWYMHHVFRVGYVKQPCQANVLLQEQVYARRVGSSCVVVLTYSSMPGILLLGYQVPGVFLACMPRISDAKCWVLSVLHPSRHGYACVWQFPIAPCYQGMLCHLLAMHVCNSLIQLQDLMEMHTTPFKFWNVHMHSQPPMQPGLFYCSPA